MRTGLTLVFAMAFAVFPAATSAKQMLGTLHHGPSLIEFVLAGEEVVVEEFTPNVPRDDIVVLVKDLGCTGVYFNNTITVRSRGSNMQHDRVFGNDRYVFDSQKLSARTWTIDSNDLASAARLADQLNRIAQCK